MRDSHVPIPAPARWEGMADLLALVPTALSWVWVAAVAAKLGVVGWALVGLTRRAA